MAKKLPWTWDWSSKDSDNIKIMSDGRLDIKLFAAGELVPAFECFDAVEKIKLNYFMLPHIIG